MLWRIEDTHRSLRLILAKDGITYPIEMTGFEGLIKILKEDYSILGKKVRKELIRKTYTEVKRRFRSGDVYIVLKAKIGDEVKIKKEGIPYGDSKVYIIRLPVKDVEDKTPKEIAEYIKKGLEKIVGWRFRGIKVDGVGVPTVIKKVRKGGEEKILEIGEMYVYKVDGDKIEGYGSDFMGSLHIGKDTGVHLGKVEGKITWKKKKLATALAIAGLIATYVLDRVGYVKTGIADTVDGMVMTYGPVIKEYAREAGEKMIEYGKRAIEEIVKYGKRAWDWVKGLFG